jgi:hypothetical protein
MRECISLLSLSNLELALELLVQNLFDASPWKDA